MNDIIKFTEDEINEIRLLQSKFQEKIMHFGNLYLRKMQIDEDIRSCQEKENELNNEIKTLQKSENELIDKIIKKYGEGSLDLKEGVFIPEKKL